MSCGSVIKVLELRWMCLLLLSPVLSIASTDSFLVVVPTKTVSGLYGSSAVLPCYLSDNKDASSLRVRWHRPKSFNNPVLIYNQKVQENEMDQLYQGRVSLYGDLKIGTVSLRLQNLTAADAGLYICHVSSETWYNTANVSLKVTAVGFTPVLYLTETVEGKVNITCQSHGWLPEPAVIWTDSNGKKVEHLCSEKFIQDSHGLITVISSLLISSSESAWFSCSVGFMNQEMKDSRISPRVLQNNKESEASWFGSFITALAFLLLLLCFSLICGFYLLKNKDLLNRKKRNTAGKVAFSEEQHTPILKSPTVPNHAGVPENLLQLTQTNVSQTSESTSTTIPSSAPTLTVDSTKSSSPGVTKFSCPPRPIVSSPATKGEGEPCPFTPTEPEFDQVQRFKENLSFNSEEVPDIHAIHEKVIYCNSPESIDDDNVNTEDYKIFALCKQKFSSGTHYWEVLVKQGNNVKSSWYVGVASEAAERMYNLPFTPENEYWVLCYLKEKGVFIKNPTAIVLLAVKPGDLKKVGVFLNCNEKSVSFFNADTKSHIHTFHNVKPKTALQPLISPGTRDNYPVTLL